MQSYTVMRMKSARSRAYEKRFDARIPVQLKVDIESCQNNYLFEISSNLSQNGIFIQTAYPLSVGSHVTIQFLLLDQQRIRTRGEVMWVNEGDDEESGMGVKFLGLKEEEREKILQALKKIAIL